MSWHQSINTTQLKCCRQLARTGDIQVLCSWTMTAPSQITAGYSAELLIAPAVGPAGLPLPVHNTRLKMQSPALGCEDAAAPGPQNADTSGVNAHGLQGWRQHCRAQQAWQQPQGWWLARVVDVSRVSLHHDKPACTSCQHARPRCTMILIWTPKGPPTRSHAMSRSYLNCRIPQHPMTMQSVFSRLRALVIVGTASIIATIENCCDCLGPHYPAPC